MKAQRDNMTVATTRIYWRALLGYKRLFGLALFSPLSALTMSVAVPFFAGNALSSTFTGHGDFWQYLWLLVASVIAGITLNMIGFYCQMELLARVMHDLQQQAFKAVLHRGIRFHTNNIGGKVVSDQLDFVSAFNMLMGGVLGTALPLGLTIVGGLTLVLLNIWQLGVYLFVLTIVMLVWAYLESRTRLTLRHNRLIATKALTAHVSDTIVNAATVKTFAAEKRETLKNNSLNRSLRDLRIRDWQRTVVSGTKRIGMLLVGLVGLVIAVHFFAGNNPATFGTSIFAFTYTLTLIMRLFEINTLTRQVEEAFLQASPMTKIILEDTEIVDAPDAKQLEIAEGGIEFKNVSFAYADAKQNARVFSKLSLTIKPGERVGLVGASGGGKTTLTRLLLRFEDIQDGQILIDGQDIRTVTQRSLRDNVGYVPQEPLLFHRSVHENIAYGKPAATLEKIRTAAKLAAANEFISELPDGYDTVVGERGVKLSGGQRQRVAIARAILKSAPILVLDEATSALDSESEALIQLAIWELLRGRTALVIAHRLSTIQKMDRIIVMEKGKIVEEGTHAKLLKQKGAYAKLWQRQSGGFLEE